MSQPENPQTTDLPQPPQAQGHDTPLALPYQGHQPPPPYGPGQGHQPPTQHAPGQGFPPAFGAPAPKKSNKPLWLAAGAGFGAGVLSTILVIVAASVVSMGSTPAFETAAETCDSSHRAGISIGDEGKSITIDTKGEDDSSGASYAEATCILTELKIPDAVVSHMDGTSSNDGRQNASWDKVDASWTYHPDSGLKVILQEAKN